MAKQKRVFMKSCPVHGEVAVAGARTINCPSCEKEGKITAFIPKSGAKAKPAAAARTAFPHGAAAPSPADQRPTLEEVSKIKAMVDSMGLDRVKSALKVAEDIA